MSIFRVNKTKNFTVMSNCHFKDYSLSFKAKGLLSTILSFPDNWDYSIEGLSRIAKDGVASVRAGIIELEEAGYITRTQSRGENGVFGKIIFNVYEEPRFPKKENDKTDTENLEDIEVNNTTDEMVDSEPLFKNRTTEQTEQSPLCDFPSTGKPSTGKPSTRKPSTRKPSTGNRTQLNTNIIKYLNNKILINQSINKDGLNDELMEKFNRTVERIKQNIDYNNFLDSDISLVDNIISVMAKVIVFYDAGKLITISGNSYPASIVKDRFLKKIHNAEVENFLLIWQNNKTKIKNVEKYMISTLFNLCDTSNAYLDNRVASDMAGGC